MYDAKNEEEYPGIYNVRRGEKIDALRHCGFDPIEIKNKYFVLLKQNLSPISSKEKERIYRDLEVERRALRAKATSKEERLAYYLGKETHQSETKQLRPPIWTCCDIHLSKPIKIGNNTYFIIPGCGARIGKWDGESRTIIHNPGCVVLQYKNAGEKK